MGHLLEKPSTRSLILRVAPSKYPNPQPRAGARDICKLTQLSRFRKLKFSVPSIAVVDCRALWFSGALAAARLTFLKHFQAPNPRKCKVRKIPDSGIFQTDPPLLLDSDCLFQFSLLGIENKDCIPWYRVLAAEVGCDRCKVAMAHAA